LAAKIVDDFSEIIGLFGCSAAKSVDDFSEIIGLFGCLAVP
jgi:hypothetical protein